MSLRLARRPVMARVYSPEAISCVTMPEIASTGSEAVYSPPQACPECGGDRVGGVPPRDDERF